jgi:hypothetical protein
LDVLNHILIILQDGVLITDNEQIYTQPENVAVVGQSTFADIGKIFVTSG